MGDIRWYKRDPDAALVGMAELTLEERGAYNTVLDLIYSRQGNVRDDDHSLAHSLGCDVRIWRRIRRRLIELGKLYVHGGMLHNNKADKEMFAAQQMIGSSAEVARHLKKIRREINVKRSNTYNQIRKKRDLY